MSDPRVVSALSSLGDAYDAAAARRRLAHDVDRTQPPVLRRPRINTFRAYDPTRPIQRSRAGAVPASEISHYADAPRGELLWLLLIGVAVLALLAWWLIS